MSGEIEPEHVSETVELAIACFAEAERSCGVMLGLFVADFAFCEGPALFTGAALFEEPAPDADADAGAFGGVADG